MSISKLGNNKGKPHGARNEQSKSKARAMNGSQSQMGHKTSGPGYSK